MKISVYDKILKSEWKISEQPQQNPDAKWRKTDRWQCIVDENDKLTGWYIHHNETDSDAKYCGCVTFVKGRAQSVVNGHFDSKKCPKFSFLGNSGNSSGIQQVFGKQGMKPDPIPGEFAEDCRKAYVDLCIDKRLPSTTLEGPAGTHFIRSIALSAAKWIKKSSAQGYDWEENILNSSTARKGISSRAKDLRKRFTYFY